MHIRLRQSLPQHFAAAEAEPDAPSPRPAPSLRGVFTERLRVEADGGVGIGVTHQFL